jgi:hypothetical protein
MSDYISLHPAPNAHDTALAVFRPVLYGEAVDWLEAHCPEDLGVFEPGFREAGAYLRLRQAEAAKAPGAGSLDHITAAYYRQAAASLRGVDGHEHSARLLEHVADDLDGGGR